MIARLADILGLDVAAVGRSNLERAVARCMERTGQSDPERYLHLLRGDPAERRRLFGAAVVQESWFFRDREPFALLESVAREFSRESHDTFRGTGPESARHAPQPLRLLSVPCATGEEPYSMALALLKAGLSPEEFRLDAADAHAPALETARLGRYGPGSFRRDLGPYAPYFRPEGQDMVLDERVRGSVRFFEGDALDPDFLAHAPPYAVIFCRNLLVYLAPAARRRLAGTLKRLLAPGGLVCTGLAELPILTGLSGLSGPDGLGFTSTGHPRASACSLRADAASVGAGFEGAASSPGGPTDSTSQGVPSAPARPEGGQAPGPLTDAGRPLSERDQSGGPLRDAERPGGVSTSLDADPRALADAGRLEEALAVLERDGAALPPSAERFHLLGVTLLALGRNQEAEAALRKAVYLDPGHAGALTHLELLHAADGRTDAASRLAGRARRASGGRS